MSEAPFFVDESVPDPCPACDGTGRVVAVIGSMAVEDIAKGEAVRFTPGGPGTIVCKACGGTGDAA